MPRVEKVRITVPGVCSEDQLEGLGPALPAGRDGHARLRQPRVLHRERGGRNRFHLHTSGNVQGVQERIVSFFLLGS